MDGQNEQQCKAYRFILTAVSFGKDEDEALQNLIEAVGEPAMQALEDEITFEVLDYAYFVREDLTPEA